MKENKWKKAGLASALVLTAALSACSGNSNDNGKAADGSSPAASPSGTASASSEAPKEIVELKGITMGTEPASGMDNFYKELDALTIPDLGAKVRFDFIPWGDEKNQISRAIAAKEYDIYVGGAWSDFAAFATKNAFADLTPLLSEVPELVEHYKGKLDDIKIDGKVYGIPQYNKPGGGSEGMLYREDLRQKWGLPEIDSLDTAQQYLYKAKDEYPDTAMINDKRFADNIWTMLAGSKYQTLVAGYAVAPVDDPYKAMSLYDTPEYKQVLEIAKKWYADGIVDHDILAAQGNATSETLELMKADKKPLEFNNHFGAVTSGYIGALKQAHPDFVYGWYDYFLNNVPSYMPFMSPNNMTMISVGAHSKHVETALKLIAKAHTDQTYFNLLQYGVKGENYNIDSDNLLDFQGIPAENRKPGWTGLWDGYMGLQEKLPGEWQAINDKLQTEGAKLAEAGGESPYGGFGFDSSGVAAELANMETVKSQYIQPLAVGITKDIDKDLANVQKQLKDAGMDKYLAELQKQLDAFAASKKQ